MVAEKIKQLREKNHFTQSSLAKKLNVTRSSVNAWEMGISVPSTALIVDLARLFQVSTDFLLGVNETATLDISMLNDKETIILYELVQYFKSLK
ncbi:MAG: helix-turn-helix transcriptional regulator [Enterocloster asparagiformis]|nr:helix-turn-helix transcriptional regulator [Enterocloster asparagiformis]